MDKMCFFAVTMAVVFSIAMSNPEDEVQILSEPVEFVMPESCKTKNMEFCFDNAGYPTAIVEELLKNLTNLEVAKDDDVGLIESRQGDTSDEDDCRSRATTAPIHYIVDEFGRDRVVVQMEGKFQQRYSVMWCDPEGAITTRSKHFLESTLKDHKLKCENKYMQYDFLVLSSKPDLLGKYKMERAKTKTGIPVCCACRYEKED